MQRVTAHRFRFKKLTLWFLLTYLSVLLVPLLFSAILPRAAQKHIRQRYIQSNSAILTHTESIVNSTISEAFDLCYFLSTETSIEKLYYIRQPFTTQMRYDISDAMMHEMTTRNSQTTVRGCMIWFAQGEFFLASSGRYSADSAYAEFFSESPLSAEQWQAWTEQLHNRDILSCGSEWYLVQSIPLRRRNIATPATAFVQISRSALIAQLNQIDWVRNGLLWIENAQGTLLLSNTEIDKNSVIFQKDNTARVGGADTLYSIHTTDNGWTYTLVMNSEELKTSQGSLTLLYILGTAGTLIIGILLAVFFTRRSYSPVRELLTLLRAHRSTSISEGELSFLQNAIRNILSTNVNMRQQMEQKNELIARNYLSRLLRGDVSPTALTEKELSDNALVLPCQGIALALVRVKDNGQYYEKISRPSEAHPVDQLYASLSQLACDLIRESYRSYVCEMGDTVVLLMNFALTTGAADLHSALLGMKQFLEDALCITLDVAVSDIHPSFFAIQQAYQECTLAMLHAPENGAALHVYRAGYASPAFRYTAEKEQALSGALMSGHREAAAGLLRELLQDNSPALSGAHSLFRCFISDIAVTLMRAAERVHDAPDALSPTAIARRIEHIHGLESAEQILLSIAEEICTAVSGEKESHNLVLLHAIYRAIAENYYDVNLDNTRLAERVGVSPSYLSRFFKQQTGTGLANYIAQERVNASKAMLESDARLSVSEISAAVGFENVATFIRVFKKYTGITPGKYQSHTVSD